MYHLINKRLTDYMYLLNGMGNTISQKDRQTYINWYKDLMTEVSTIKWSGNNECSMENVN